MSQRVTKRQIENAFRMLCSALGKKVAENYQDTGAWQLNYNSIYGGWVIEEKLEKGCISHPFGHTRYKAYEFVQQLYFGLRCVSIDRDPTSCGYWPKDKVTN